MTNPKKRKTLRRRRSTMSVRRKVRRNVGRPRLSVFRSLKNIYCQIIDDESGRTLASVSSRDKDLRGSFAGLKKTEVATAVGTELAGRAKAAGVVKVAFDRGYYKFHGRVKALAEAARQGGLEF